MAAPTPVTRTTPTGKLLKDGFRSFVAITSHPGINLFEKGAKPPGLDGGDPIEITHFHNTEYRTMAARALKTLTQSTFRFEYDPGAYTHMRSIINREQAISQYFNDGSRLTYWGYVKALEFDEMVEGTAPEGTATIVPTNYDPDNDVEAGPVLTEVTGT